MSDEVLEATKIFSGASDSKLPSNVEGLSLATRKQWVGAWNGRFRDCRSDGGSMSTCESSAFAVANAAIKELNVEDHAEPTPDGQIATKEPETATAEPETSTGKAEKPTERKKDHQFVDSWEYSSRQVSQTNANYMPLGGTGERACANCQFFISPAACSVVENFPQAISPTGLSDLWRARELPIDAMTPIPVVIVEEQDAALSEVGDGSKRYSVTFPPALKDRFFGAIKGLANLTHKETSSADSPFIVQKDKSGEWRWFARASNKWRDLDHPPEILSEAAHKDYVNWVDATGAYPDLWLWHTPGTKVGKADWVDYSEGFLHFSGTFDEGKEAVALNLQATPELGVSHGFKYVHSDESQGIIGWYRTFEVSPLPRSAAANPWTTMEVIQKELGMAFDSKKRAFLVAQLGEEETARRENDTKAAATALAEAGVESKQASDPAPGGGSGEGPKPEPSQTPAAGEGAPVTAKDIGDAAAKAIMDSDFFKEMVATVDAVQVLSEKNAAALKGLQLSDDEKIAGQFTARAAAARLGGHSAAESDKTIIGDDDPLAKVGEPAMQVIDERFAGSLK